MLAFIQALRGIAVLTVVVYHYFGGRRPVQYGYLGVDLFFVISGLIMVHITIDGRQSASAFLSKRLLRIWPTYAVLSVATLLTCSPLIHDVGISESVWRLVQSLSFVPMWETQPVIEPGWSLVFEVYFYVVFAAGLAFGRWRLLALTLILLLGLLAVPLLSASPFDLAQPPAFDPHGIGAYLAVITSPINWCFLAGVAVGAIMHRNLSISRGAAWISAATIVLGASLFWWFIPPRHGIESAVIMGAIVLVIGLTNNRQPIKAPRWLVWIGDISFSIYLIHLPLKYLSTAHVLWWMAGSQYINLSFGVRYAIAFVPFFAAVLALSALSRVWLEVRLSNWIAAQFDSKTPVISITSPLAPG